LFHSLPAVPPRRADAAGEHVEEEERPRHLPAAQVADAGRAPDMRGQLAVALADPRRGLADALHRNLRFFGRTLEGELGVERFQRAVELASKERELSIVNC
jgi:hypothetical protein